MLNKEHLQLNQVYNFIDHLFLISFLYLSNYLLLQIGILYEPNHGVGGQSNFLLLECCNQMNTYRKIIVD